MSKQTELEQEAGRRALAKRASASPNSAQAQAAAVVEPATEEAPAPKKRTRKPRTIVADAPMTVEEVEAEVEPEANSSDELDDLLKE